MKSTNPWSMGLLLLMETKKIKRKTAMFGLFKKKSEKEKLEDEYKKLMKEAFDLSKTNRSASDGKYEEADKIQKRIALLEEK